MSSPWFVSLTTALHKRYLLVDPALWTLGTTAVCVILWGNARAMAAEYPDEDDSSDMTHVHHSFHSAEHVQRRNDHQNVISMKKAILLPVFGSVVLLVLFYLLNWIKFIFLILISFSCFISISWLTYSSYSKLLHSSLCMVRFPTVPKYIRCTEDTTEPTGSEQEDTDDSEMLLDLAGDAQGQSDAADTWHSDSDEDEDADLNSIGREDSEYSRPTTVPRSAIVGVCGPPSVAGAVRRFFLETIGISYFPIALLMSILTATLMLVLWYTTNHWLVLNIVAICMAVTSLSSLRLQSIKVASVFLILFFLYDIFWVFLSSYFFKESVMEAVARGVSNSTVAGGGIDLPILIRCPKLTYGEIGSLAGPNPLWLNRPSSAAYGHIWGLAHMVYQFFFSESLGFMMLGLGDIILPGVFINFLRRFDYEKGYMWWPNGYTTIGLVGYVVGLFSTFVALIVLRRGQPALLYLVPCCLIPVVISSWRHNDLKDMWVGMSREEEGSDDAHPTQEAAETTV